MENWQNLHLPVTLNKRRRPKGSKSYFEPYTKEKKCLDDSADLITQERLDEENLIRKEKEGMGEDHFPKSFSGNSNKVSAS